MSTSMPQLGPNEFAAKIKAQHPQYASLPDEELSKKVLDKYPQYWKTVDAGKFAAKGMWQPSSTEQPTQSSGAIVNPQTGQPRGESMMGKNMESAVGAASPILATVGGVLGSAAGPAGAVTGAAAGGAIGEDLKEKATGTQTSYGPAVAGTVQGALELVGGQLLPKALERVGVSAIPKVLKGVNNYIGLKPADLPKWGRTVEDANDIAKTVMEEAGVKKTLPMQRDAIEAARALRNTQTERIVASPNGKLVDFDAKILDRAVELDKAVSLGEFPETTKNMIDANLEEMKKVSGEHGAAASGKMTPPQMHAMRKSIQQQIKDWNPETTNPRQWFLQKVYHDLNDSIEQGLPASEAKAFRSNNKIQTNLIIAREAAKEKILGKELKDTPGLVTSAVNRTGGALIGAGSGTLIAGETGQSKEKGAIIGGLIGAGLGSYGRHLGKAELPAADIAAQKAISNAAPYLAKASKYSAPAVRSVQAAIDAIRSRQPNQ